MKHHRRKTQFCGIFLWEETWRQKLGPMQGRPCKYSKNEKFYTEEFYQQILSLNNSTSEGKLDTFSQLEEFVYFNILRGFYECGWVPDVGRQFKPSELALELKIEDKFHKFFGFLLKVLEEEGILQKVKEGGEWKVCQMPPDYSHVRSLLSSPLFTKELPSKFRPTVLLGKVGESLCEIFQGKKVALEVLFPDSQQECPSVGDFYVDYGKYFEGTTSIIAVGKEKLKYSIGRSKGDRHILRIIEIGAGTGFYANMMLPTLEELGAEYEYTYTDISPAFFQGAEKKFDKYLKNLNFKKLNIEEDPIAQGFTPEYYDLAIASDVIHATKDLRQSLRNVKMLLRDGGEFDIVEQTKVNRIITYLFGLMEGFWRFEDLELRPDHCTMSVEKWREVFEQEGFSVTGEFPCVNGYHAKICTRKRDIVKKDRYQLSDRAWIIYGNGEGCGQQDVGGVLRQKLESTGRQVVVVKRSEGGDGYLQSHDNQYSVRSGCKEDFEQLMKAISSRKVIAEGVVYAWPLDKTRTEQRDILEPYLYITQTLSLLKQKSTPRLIALTSGIAPLPGKDVDMSHFHSSTVWGFTKALKNENVEMNCRCVDISDGGLEGMQEVFYEIWSDDKESQVAYHGGSRYIPRFQPHKPQQNALSIPTGTDRFQVVLPETKSISDLQFGPLDQEALQLNEIEIQIKASALNFRDVLSVLKPIELFKNINTIGSDFAGVVKRVGGQVSKWKVGDAVFGVNMNGAALPSHIVLDEEDVVRVPDEMTLCEAATLPVVFATAYYCLVEVAQVKSSDTVLIHTATGGVGLSAIEILKHVGATIVATAGSKRKQSYLRSLGIEHIFHSRNTNYKDDILNLTNGRGVDVVLNSLTSEGFKEATLKCCAKGARFVEMSKLSIWKPEEVKGLRPDVDYTIQDLSSMDKTVWRRLMSNLKFFIDKKIVKPIPYVRFDAVNIRDAMYYLQKAKHIGKVVCTFPNVKLEQGQMKVCSPMFNDRSTYLITGGLGGIGFEVAKWMLKSGAKHLILASRSPPSQTAQAIIDQLNLEGAHITPVQLDVGNYEACERQFSEISRPGSGHPPLRGVMHAAGTLSDGLIANQDWPKLSSTFNTKIQGTLNLHRLTLDNAYPLEHFVVFSSAAALFGSPGQCNHAAGNNFEDTFMHYRHSIGLPATSVNWGQWGQVGVATEVDLPGVKTISTSQGLAALEYIMKSQRTQLAALNMESFVLFSKLFPQMATYLDEKVWKSANSGARSSGGIKSEEFWQQYEAKVDKEEKCELVKVSLRYALRKILKVDEMEVIEDDANFQEMGVDSLMYVEIKNAIQAMLGDRVTVNASLLRDCNTVRLLADQLISLIEGDSEEESTEPGGFEEIIRQLKSDCKLDDNITAEGKISKNIQDVECVLLTGVTGTLGPYVLAELLSTPQVKKVYCLLRPQRDMTVEDRLKKVLGEKQLEISLTKVHCLVGNVAQENLGLNTETWKCLSGEVDAVVHCAVRADHLERYKVKQRESDTNVHGVNITGTKNILWFAIESKVKHVYFASSLVGVVTTDQDGRLSESWPNTEEDLETIARVTQFAYPISKFVGEVLMKQAVERGIPCKVFRFPFISGHSKTGRCSLTSNHFMTRCQFILKSGAMPSNPFPLTLLPVDLCAQVSTQLFFMADAPSDVYNVTHRDTHVDQVLCQVAGKLGYKVEPVEMSEFVKLLEEDEDQSGYSMFKDFYKDQDELVMLQATVPAIRSWLEGFETFGVSKKLTHFLPKFYQDLEPVLDYLERDLVFGQATGWF